MAKYSNTVEYNIRTTLDTSGIAKLKAELTNLQNITKTKGTQGLLDPSIVNKTLADINKVKVALNQAFNPKLGMVNNRALFNSIGKDLNSIYGSFSKLGPQGVKAFAQVYQQVGKIDTGMKQISSTSDKIMNTFGNTFRWGFIASIFSNIMNAAHQSVQYVKDLDESLTNIMMVSGETRDNMNEYARAANEAAKALGNTTVGMTNATQVFVQQGYDLSTSQTLAEYAVKLGNVSQQDTATASDELTAYMNAYKISLDDIGNALSKWALVANVSAADVQELSIAAQKAASAAVTTGVNMDQLAAQIAAIETVTREAPENIGNGLKTIYARFSDIKMGETLEDGVNLGKVTSTLQKVGVQVLDAEGNMREVGNIMEDLMDVWGTLDLTQKNAIGQTLAGKFQYSRFSALMNRSDLYKEYLAASEGETGTQTLDFMQKTYEESMQGRLNTLTATIEGIFTNAFNTDNFYKLVDAGTKLAETLDNLIQAVGGGGQAILALSAIITKSFSNNMGRGIANMISNRATNAQATDNRLAAAQMAQTQLAGQGLNIKNQQVMNLANNRANINQYAPIMNNEQIEKGNQLFEKQATVLQQLITVEEEYEQKTTAAKSALIQLGFSSEEVNSSLMGLLRAIEAGGEEAKITKEVLESLNLDKIINQLYQGQTSISSFIQALERAQKTGEGWEKVQTSAMKLGPALQAIGEKAGWTGEKMEVLQQILNQLKVVENGDIQSIEGLVEALRTAGVGVESFREGLVKLQSTTVIDIEELDRLKSSADATGASFQHLLTEGKGMAQGLQIQNVASGFTNLASAGMSAVFALQSIHHIMDIINNDELTFAEKAEQLAMNFTMVAAMGIPAITQTKQAITGISQAYQMWATSQRTVIAVDTIFNQQQALNIALRGNKLKSIVQELAAQGELNKENLEARLIEEGYTKTKAKEIATKTMNIVTTNLEKKATEKNIILKNLEIKIRERLIAVMAAEKAARIAAMLTSGPAIAAYIAIAAAIGVVIAAIKKHSEELERRKEIQQQQIDASNDLVRTIKENSDNLNELYDQYKTSGEASDEFKDALLDQAEALDINNAQLLIATGQYDRLKESIDEAAASALQYNSVLLEQQNEDLTENLSEQYEDEHITSDQIIGSNQNRRAPASRQTITIGYEDLIKLQEESNQLIDQQNELLDQKTQLLLEGIDAESEEIKIIDEQIAAIQDRQFEIQDVLGSEDAQQLLNNTQQIVDNQIAIIVSGQNELFNQLRVTSVEELGWMIQNGYLGPELQEYFASLGPEAAEAFLLSLAQTLVDADLSNVFISQDSLGLIEAFQTQSQTFGEYWGNNKAEEVFQQASMEQMLANPEWVGGGMAGPYSIAPEFYELNDEDRARIILSLDMTKTQEQLAGDINEVIRQLNEGATLDEIELTANTHFGTEDALALGPQDEDVKVEEFEQLASYLGENAEELDGFSEELENNGEELAEVTEEILRYDSAVQEATEHMDEWEDALKSDNMKERAKAAEELTNVYADLLDIGEDVSLSGDFVEDAENLELLEKAINGDVEAYEELQRRAAHDILIHAGVDDAEAWAQLDALDAEKERIGFEDIEIGAAIDDEGFIASCEEMINAAGMTAEEAQAYLSELGVDAEVTTDTEEQDTSSTYTNLIPHIVNTTATYTLPSGDGFNPSTTTEVSIPSITYEAVPQTMPSTMVAGGFSLQTTSGGKSSGGNLHISSARKGATPGAKNASATRKPSSGGSGGGGKGGGKGGSGKSYTAKNKDYEKKEKDRYEKVNTALDKIDSTLKNVEMDQDRLISNRWLDNLSKETDLLKQQIPWYEKKLEIQKEEAKELRDQLAADFGATFYDNGQLQNYADIFDRLENERRRLIEQYNATGDEAGQTALEKQIEDIEKKQDIFDKIYSRYDELYSKDIPDTEKALKEIQDRLEDIADEAREARREAAEALDDIRKTAEEFDQSMGNIFGQHIELDLRINNQRMEDILGNPVGELQNQIDRYQEMLQDSTIPEEQKKWLQRQIDLMNDAITNGTSILDLNLQRLNEIAKYTEEWERNGFYTIDGQRSYNEEALHNMWEQALEDASNFAKELGDAIQNHLDLLNDLIDQMDDAADNLYGSYDAIGDKLEYIQEMNELLYGEKASQEQVDLYRAQAQNEEERLKALEAQLKVAHTITEERRILWENDKDNVDLQKDYFDALDKERDIDSEILDVRKDITEAYKDAAEAANELAVQDWLSNFAGTINGVEVPLEYMADQWERISENEDLYLDDLNKAYEIQKLQNKYQEMLNEATDPAIQQQITDQMNQQLAYLRDKTNLSKYDVEYANAQLEILQKTIALEDARDAKNQMKLRRDSQGNYQYVYTTNRNNVAEAENDLLDASMNAYNMSKEQQGDVQDNYIKKVQDMADAMRKVMNDATLDAEQRQAIIEDIIQSGYEYLDAMGEQLSTSQRNMIESFIEAAEEMQAENAEYVQFVADGLKEGTITTLDEIDDRFDTSVKNWIGEDGLALFRNEAENTKDDIITNIHEFEDATNEANDNLAQPLNDLETNYADVADEVARTKEEARELFDLLGSNTDVFTKAAADVAMWQSQLEKSNSAIQDYKKQIKSLQDKNAALEAANTQLYSSGSADGSGSGGAGLGSGAAGLGKKPGDRRAGDYTGYTGRYYENSWGEGRSGAVGSGVKGAVKISAFSAKPYGDGRYRTGEYSVHLEDLNGGYLGWIKPSQMFDTGGYTGNWNGDGRMAMLHQKELVLNATDTENILAAVDAVRLITEQLKASSFVNNIVNAVGKASQNKIQGSNVEQRVEITANFPNVNSAEEIERALLSMSDTSYQYAYNKNNIPW